MRRAACTYTCVRRLAREFQPFGQWFHIWPAVYVLFFGPKLAKKCLFPRFWALFPKISQKKCNFLHILFFRWSCYMSHFFLENCQKVLNYAYFAHFCPKKFKKSAIFVHIVVPHELAYVPVMCHEIGQNVRITPILSDKLKKSSIFCNFLQFSVRPICPIFRPHFGKKYCFSSILSTLCPNFWKKVQFFAHEIRPQNSAMCHEIAHLQYKCIVKWPEFQKKCNFLHKPFCMGKLKKVQFLKKSSIFCNFCATCIRPQNSKWARNVLYFGLFQ